MGFACHRFTPVSKVTVSLSIMMSAAALKSNGKYPYLEGGESSIVVIGSLSAKIMEPKTSQRRERWLSN
jgi:hypothetical protein